jgi:hypothetical protein
MSKKSKRNEGRSVPPAQASFDDLKRKLEGASLPGALWEDEFGRVRRELLGPGMAAPKEEEEEGPSPDTVKNPSPTFEIRGDGSIHIGGGPVRATGGLVPKPVSVAPKSGPAVPAWPRASAVTFGPPAPSGSSSGPHISASSGTFSVGGMTAELKKEEEPVKKPDLVLLPQKMPAKVLIAFIDEETGEMRNEPFWAAYLKPTDVDLSYSGEFPEDARITVTLSLVKFFDQ